MRHSSSGQSIIVTNPCDRAYTREYADGRLIYVIPRPAGGGTVVGATREAINWNPDVDQGTRVALMYTAVEICPEIVTNGLPPDAGGIEVLQDTVGRRWARKRGPRIERETKGDKII